MKLGVGVSVTFFVDVFVPSPPKPKYCTVHSVRFIGCFTSLLITLSHWKTKRWLKKRPSGLAILALSLSLVGIVSLGGLDDCKFPLLLWFQSFTSAWRRSLTCSPSLSLSSLVCVTRFNGDATLVLSTATCLFSRKRYFVQMDRDSRIRYSCRVRCTVVSLWLSFPMSVKLLTQRSSRWLSVSI